MRCLAEVEGVLSGDVCTVNTYTGNTATAVGSYTATATALTNANYALPTAASHGWTITAATGDLTVTLSPESYTYDGTAHEPTVTVEQGGLTIPAGEYTVAYSDNKNAGQATVTITDKPGGNFSFADTTSHFTIAQREVTLTWSDDTFTYDGTAKSVTATLGNIVTDDDCVIATYSGNTATAVGSYTATAESLTNANYALPTAACHGWTITAAIVVDYVVEESPDSFRFDGTAHTPSITIRDAQGNVIPAQEYNVSYVNNVDASGEAKIIITDAAGGNFDVQDREVYFTILPKTLTVKVDSFDKKKPYDGTTSVANVRYTLIGVVDGFDPGFAVSLAYDTPAVGTNKPITATYTLGSANYQLVAQSEVVATDGEITPLDRLIADYHFTAPADLVYNGSPKPATVTGPGEIKIFYSADNGNVWTTDAPVDVDNYIVKIVVEADEQYRAAEFVNDSWWFDIIKADRSAPDVTGKPTSRPSKEDGQFVGATTEMEFCLDGDDTFTPVLDPAMLLASGTYKIRYPESRNYYASPITTVVIKKGDKLHREVEDYVVTLPESLSFDGEPKVVTVEGDGNITVYYKNGQQAWTTTPPVEPGTYNVRFSVDETEDYYSALFTDEAWDMTIVRDLLIVENLVADADGYCPGTTGSASYTIISGHPTDYRIVVKSDSTSIYDADFTPITNEGVLNFSLEPTSEQKVTLLVQFSEFDGLTSDVYELQVSVNLSSDYLTDIFSDVVSIINKVDLSNPSDLTPRFHYYQWYHNGEEIPDATRPYYQQIGGLSGTYHARVITVDGDELYTCPKTFNDNKSIMLRIYPNPVVNMVNIELTNDVGEAHKFSIVDNKGLKVHQGEFLGSHTSVDMSSYETGYYIVVVDNLKANVVKK